MTDRAMFQRAPDDWEKLRHDFPGGAAARDAARDAAWDAARDAERAWQTARLLAYLDGTLTADTQED